MCGLTVAFRIEAATPVLRHLCFTREGSKNKRGYAPPEALQYLDGKLHHHTLIISFDGWYNNMYIVVAVNYGTFFRQMNLTAAGDGVWS